MACVPSEDSDQPRHLPVWSESSLSAWRNLRSLATHWMHSLDSDQTGRMLRLIWVFAGWTCHFVGFVMRQLNYNMYSCLMLDIHNNSEVCTRSNYEFFLCYEVFPTVPVLATLWVGTLILFATFQEQANLVKGYDFSCKDPKSQVYLIFWNLKYLEIWFFHVTHTVSVFMVWVNF